MALTVSLSVNSLTQTTCSIYASVDNTTGSATTYWSVYRGSTLIRNVSSVGAGSNANVVIDDWANVGYDTTYNYFLYGGATAARATQSSSDYNRTLTLVTYPAVPTWTDTSAVAFRQNVAVSYSMSGRVSNTNSWNTGMTLPAGLSINSSGTISGTPTSFSVGSPTYTFTANNIGVYSSPQEVSSTSQSIVITVAQTWVLTYNSNGATSGSVPTDSTRYDTNASATLAGNTGSLSKTGYSFGGWSTTVGGSAVSTVTMGPDVTVYAVWNAVYPPAWSDTTIAAFTYGSSYSDGVSATNMSYSGSYSRTGTLPTGISFNTSTGAITGTPTVGSEAYNFSITATNSYGSTSPLTFSGNVSAAPTYPPTWSDNVLGGFQVSVAYSDGVAATNMSYSGSYSVSAGTLPAGISLNTSSGAVTGTPTATGSFSFSITASNSYGSVTQAFSGTVAAAPAFPPTWSDSVLGAFYINKAYSDGVAATSMSYAGSYTVSSGALPAGISLNASTGAVTGTPTAVGAYSFVITAANTYGSITQSFSGTVLGGLNVYDGTTWAKKLVKVYNGSTWVTGTVYVYNGSSWVGTT